MAQVPVGLQLYSVRKDCERDLAGTLRQVAQMGYAGVEFAGYHGVSAQELRRMLDDLGLRCAGSHVPFSALGEGELEKTAEFNRTLGNRYLICPSLPAEYRETADGWKRAAEALSRAAEGLRSAGLRVGYHNHSIEFRPLGGTTPWQIMLRETSPEVVLQLDTGNAMHGGADPVALLEECAGRALTVHLKEYSSTNEKALIGEGEVDWERVFSLCEGGGRTEWYIVEQETYAYEPLECVRRCLENLRRMGK